ncbi:MAG TPA: hypothetical protein VM937_05580 [Burkholderiaceae bacterium]|nr:hypothetical protein [Burkholderiaceae bacterium]
MLTQTDAALNAAHAEQPIDVLAFPPDSLDLQRRRVFESRPWRELERRARVARFFGVGMFLAWAADVGAAFEVTSDGGSALFGVVSVPLALVVLLAHFYAQWALERSARGFAEIGRLYSDVTVREAAPLLELAREHAAIAQYLRCVGRQARPLLRLERIALYAWSKKGAAGGSMPATERHPPP